MQKLLIFCDSHTEKIMFSRIYQDYMCVYKIVIQLIVIAIIMFCFNVIVTHCHYCHYPKVEFVKYLIRARFHVCQYLFIIPQEHHMIVVPVIVFTSMLMLFSTLNSQISLKISTDKHTGSRIKLLPYTNFYLEVYATK